VSRRLGRANWPGARESMTSRQPCQDGAARRRLPRFGQDRDVEVLTELIGRSAKAGQALAVIVVPSICRSALFGAAQDVATPPVPACLPRSV